MRRPRQWLLLVLATLVCGACGTSPEPTAQVRDFVAQTYPAARFTQCRDVEPPSPDGAQLVYCTVPIASKALRRDVSREDGLRTRSRVPSVCFTVWHENVVIHGSGYPAVIGTTVDHPCVDLSR